MPSASPAFPQIADGDLWDVWERKQQRLGLPTLPAGVELRTDLPESEKSAAEKATDFYRWAREPLLFFVDQRGEPVTKTNAGDYISMATFGYDYEPGSGGETSCALMCSTT